MPNRNIIKGPDSRLVQASLARESHLEFMKMMWQRRNPLIIGRHTEEVCSVLDQAIEDYKNGKSSFLAIKIPFRHGKSDIATRYLPANFIGKFPDEEVIVAAYASPLARTFSRFCRSVMLDPLYQYIYPGVGMAKDQRSVDEWGIEGYHGLTSWLGIGGSITGKGANCFPAGTMVKTNKGNVDIAHLYNAYNEYKVLTNNCGKLEYREISASHKEKSKNIVKVITDTGRHFVCTEDHRIYSSGEYVQAKELIVGQCVVICDNNVSVKTEKVALVQRLCKGEVDVYDIQVEKTHNYFANNVLVHNCVIIDDFFKNRAAAESEVVREYVWESITNDILTRRAPVSIVIILATPWHVDDAFGRIEKHRKLDPDFPEFREVKLPAFSDKYPTGTLFPERFSKSWYLSQKAILGPYGFAGLMQCDPVARGGNLFEVDKIKEFEGDLPEGLMMSRGWDLASKEKERVDEDPDYTDGVKIGVRWLTLADGQSMPEIWVDDIIDGRWAAPVRNKMIKASVIGDGPQTQVAIESFGPYRDAFEEISKALKGIRKVKALQLPGDKVSKASVLEAPIAAGNVHVRKGMPWTEKFKKQLREFPGGAHDDMVDGFVVAYEGLNPYEKRVWPQLQGRHIIDLNINWNLTKNNPYASLHYAGLWQKEDLSVWVVLCLWDALKGFLFVYDGFMVEDAIPGAVLPRLIKRARLKDYACEGIVCSPLMWEQKGYSKNVALQYRRELNKVNISAPVREAFNFDEYGSIIEIGQLFDTNMIRVDSKAKSMLLQMMSWVTINRGKNLGSKPDTEDDGYCRALCLIVSELRRQELWTQIIKPILADYNKAELVQKIYDSKKIR